MHSTLKILTNRMDSHPEEFIAPSKRWEEVIELVINRPEQTPWITVEDRARFSEKFFELQERKFTELVMNTLFAADDSCRDNKDKKIRDGRPEFGRGKYYGGGT